MKQLDDISLVTQVAVFHNRKAFDRLVVKYQSPIRRFFLAQTGGDVQLSDDLAQDTFVKAYTHITHFRGLSSFSTWLYRIAYNTFYDYMKCNKPTDNIESPSMLEQALCILSDKERLCITLQLLEGQAIDKISEITGMTEGTVKSHLSRGKQKLTTYLKHNGYDRK